MNKIDCPVILTGTIETLPLISIFMDGATHRLVIGSGFVRLKPEDDMVLEDFKALADSADVAVVVGRYTQVETITLLVRKVARIVLTLDPALTINRDPGDAFPWRQFAIRPLRDPGDTWPW